MQNSAQVEGDDTESTSGETKLPISIQETGPRMSLTLYKIEYRGKLLFHKFKSTEEINETIKEYVAKEELREKRKRKQERNVRKKQKTKESQES